ncbi:C-X-C motif chemokine 16-like [Ochotona curzoniae]|uniref:C-X-C motif chemokine 16-like n=1 Tax=Ochotona curzoniae TaxID=130825 RepID=UPI001B34FC13|nr:C-X-C motif chemokine 16-like [Ochotona curzoniae]
MTQEEALLLLLLLLSGPTVPGYANEGSVAGSCHCDKRIPSGSPPPPELMDHLQKHLWSYHRCPGYIRFQLRRRSVCGSVHAGWVQELLQCFRLKECGHAHRKDLAHHQHFPPHNTQTQESPDEAPAGMHTTARTNQATTLQAIQIPGAPGNETTTVPGNHHVGAGPEAREDQKHLEEGVGSAATTATRAVLSLLVITLLLTGVLTNISAGTEGIRSCGALQVDSLSETSLRA